MLIKKRKRKKGKRKLPNRKLAKYVNSMPASKHWDHAGLKMAYDLHPSNC